MHFLLRAWQRQRSACHLFRLRVVGDSFSFIEQKNCVDRVWIIDVIRRDAGRIGSAARLCGEHLVEKAALLDVAGEDFSFVDVLIANRRREIFPARIFGIVRRITRIWRNVAGPTSHSDAIRADKLVVVVIRRIIHEAIAVPSLPCFIIEFRIWKKPKAENAGRFAVNSFVDTGGVRVYLLLEPQPKLVRLGGSAKSGLVHEAQGFETLAPRKFAVVEHLQKIHQSVAVLCSAIPKMLVASTPEIPRIAPHYFLWRKIDAAVHWLE